MSLNQVYHNLDEFLAAAMSICYSRFPKPVSHELFLTSFLEFLRLAEVIFSAYDVFEPGRCHEPDAQGHWFLRSITQNDGNVVFAIDELTIRLSGTIARRPYAVAVVRNAMRLAEHFLGQQSLFPEKNEKSS